MRLSPLLLSILLWVTGANASIQLYELSLIGKTSASFYSGHSYDVSGRYWDNTRFYKQGTGQLSGKIAFLTDLTNGDALIFGVRFDLGANSAAMTVDPISSLDFGYVRLISDNDLLLLRVNNLLTFGGNVTERPCYDDFDRNFHCATLLPWSDYRADFEGYRGLYSPELQVLLKWNF